VAEFQRPFTRSETDSYINEPQLSDVYAIVFTSSFARLLDLGVVLSVCVFFYLVN